MRTAAFGLGLVLAGCAPPPSPPEAGPAADTPVITLERTACFGRCPVYQLSISGAGVIRYQGKANVRHLGLAEDTIPAARVDSLVNQLEQQGYFSFAEGYEHDSPACGSYSTDSPSVVTAVVAGGQRKQIRHDYGCSDTPPALARLESRIDEVAGSARWTGR